MGARAALLDSADVHGGCPEIYLIPTQVRRLACPQAVPVGHQDHGGVAVRPAISLGGMKQPVDLGFG
jgi:hypothetical protein